MRAQAELVTGPMENVVAHGLERATANTTSDFFNTLRCRKIRLRAPSSARVVRFICASEHRVVHREMYREVHPEVLYLRHEPKDTPRIEILKMRLRAPRKARRKKRFICASDPVNAERQDSDLLNSRTRTPGLLSPGLPDSRTSASCWISGPGLQDSKDSRTHATLAKSKDSRTHATLAKSSFFTVSEFVGQTPGY